MYDLVEMGERIKELRKKNHMTQAQLAELLHLSDKSAVSKIENGIKPLSIDQAVIISDAFGTSLNYLIRGERFESNDFISMLERVPGEQRAVAEKMIMAALESLVK